MSASENGPALLEESGMLHNVTRRWATLPLLLGQCTEASLRYAHGGLLSTDRAAIRTLSPRRSGTSVPGRTLLLMRTLARSMRMGPTGEAHIRLAPTDERIVELSARQTCHRLPGAAQRSRRSRRHPQGAGVGEHGAGDAEVVRHERDGEADFRRRRPDTLAPPSASPGVQVARP